MFTTPECYLFVDEAGSTTSDGRFLQSHFIIEGNTPRRLKEQSSDLPGERIRDGCFHSGARGRSERHPSESLIAFP